MDCPALDEAPKKHGKAFAGPGFGEGAIDCNSSFLSVKSEFDEEGLGAGNHKVSHRRPSGGQKIRVGRFGPRPTGRCRLRGVPSRRAGRLFRARGHGRAPVVPTGRRQWRTTASGRLGMQANQTHQVVGEHRRLNVGHCQSNWTKPQELAIEDSQAASWRHSVRAAARCCLYVAARIMLRRAGIAALDMKILVLSAT